MAASQRPPFEALPLDPNGPPGNAWGLYGDDDELGTLHLLTPDVVASAASGEIRTGERVALDWALTKPARPSFDRPPFQWTIERNQDGLAIHDDHLAFNTQCSSQWDGLRHFGYQRTKQFYGGRTPEDFQNSQVLGIQNWIGRGGIVGRGVLLDYVAFCQRHGLQVDAFKSAAMPVKHLQQMVREADLTIRSGDILLIRFGFTLAYSRLSTAEQDALAQRQNPDFLGLDSTVATLRWLWESGFAAAAGDAPSFEQAPVRGLWTSDKMEDGVRDGGLIHQVLLGGWGMPIGEMFDLEKLAETCQRLGRWSFFFSSVPLHVPGGVASPPNAVAIF